ncbi:MAG: hypothetical protein P4L40_20715, partial [Terracidiphilus sp.]|nr:hypothetical protein [Terracidiphilus sp.]
ETHQRTRGSGRRSCGILRLDDACLLQLNLLLDLKGFSSEALLLLKEALKLSSGPADLSFLTALSLCLTRNLRLLAFPERRQRDRSSACLRGRSDGGG